MSRRAIALATGFILVLASSAGATRLTISGVPSYIWYHGCGPTAGGMIIGYWDAHGYPGLIPGSNDWYTNQQAIKDMIASPGHVLDYVPTPDRVPTASLPLHADDSVADFNRCSRDPSEYGYSILPKQDDGMIGYAVYRGYDLASGSSQTYYSETFWAQFVAEIDAGRPVELLVDTNADGMSDHFVAAIGYDDTPKARQFAYYNTWDHTLRWSSFTRIAAGVTYGIYGGAFFDPGPGAGDANGDGVVDSEDLAEWQMNYDPVGLNQNVFSMGDWNVDGLVDSSDLALWQTAVSVGSASATEAPQSLPEPGTLALVSIILSGIVLARRRR